MQFFRIKFLFYLIFLKCVSAKSDVKLVITKLGCVDKAPGLFKTLNCSVIQRNQTSYFSVAVTLNKVLPKLKLRAVIDVYNEKNSKFRLMDVYEDACKFLITDHKLTLYRNALKNIRKFVNQMPKCPLMADFNYLVTDMHYNLDDLPSFTPEMKYRFIVSFFVSGKMVTELNVSGEIIKSLKLNATLRNR